MNDISDTADDQSAVRFSKRAEEAKKGPFGKTNPFWGPDGRNFLRRLPLPVRESSLTITMVFSQNND
jgi:hypothetical protein